MAHIFGQVLLDVQVSHEAGAQIVIACFVVSVFGWRHSDVADEGPGKKYLIFKDIAWPAQDPVAQDLKGKDATLKTKSILDVGVFASVSLFRLARAELVHGGAVLSAVGTDRGRNY